MTPLQPIAKEIVRLSEQRALTPVIVTPRYLSLQPAFLLALSDALSTHSDRAVRFDWCRPVPSVWSLISDRVAAAQTKLINRQLHRSSISRGTTATLQITASISRPGGAHRELVIGLCTDDHALPTWTVPIHLSGASAAQQAVA